MISLDEKLDKIIINSLNEYRPEGKPIREITNAIKQAFIDAGWLDTTQLGGIKSTTICRPEGNIE